jgi:hypothetical protein
MFSSNTTQAGPSGPANYIEEVFSTDLYTGTSASQTITNGIDLATKGGLVWAKRRNAGGTAHYFIDTARGRGSYLVSNTTAAATNQATSTNDFTSFNSNGFTLGIPTSIWMNETTGTYASWTFRKQPKFFDVVTYTGNGAAARAISHNLGSVPGCMIVKSTSEAGNWRVYHRGCSTNNGLVLNDTGAQTTSAIYWFGDEVNVIPPTSTQFTVNAGFTNINGATYVAYLFAHDASGFGLTGTDNVITCGSYTGVTYPGDVAVTLGYEPQWVMVKNTTQSSDWVIYDNMRGMPVSTSATGYNYLVANTTGAENSGSAPGISPTATGFIARAGLTAVSGTAGDKIIYIAIRRGPMRVPTSGTSVFLPSQQPEANGGSGFIVTTTFPPDLFISSTRGSNSYNRSWFDRLRGNTLLLSTSTAAETSIGTTPFGIVKNGLRPNMFSTNPVQYMFGRAPGFFDEVCYTGTGVAGLSVTHNLTVPPEMIIVKRRNSTGDWPVLMRNVDRLGGAGSSYRVNSTASWDPAGPYFSDASGLFVPATDATSTVFRVSNAPAVNASGGTHVAYLFATCAGVSKVGSYTSTGTTLQIDCGFTAGARFVMIKRTDAVGDWYVWDSSRGITSGIDPYFLFNNIAAEELTDYLAPYSAGFAVNAGQFVDVNTSGGTYIFLAIA